MLCIEGIRWIFEDRLPIVIYTGHCFLSPAKFKRCVPSDMNIKGTSVSPTLSIDLIFISMRLSWSISPYLCLPPPVRSVHICIEAFRWRNAVNAKLRDVNEMLHVGWLLHQPSHASDDVSTPVYHGALWIVIPSYILTRVQFPLPEKLIISHASHEVLDAIPLIEVWETRSGVSLLQNVVIVRLHALLLDTTLDICVLSKRCKWVVGIVL